MQKKKVNFSQEVEMGMRTNIHNIPISNLDDAKAKPVEDSFRDNIDQLRQQIEPVASQGNQHSSSNLNASVSQKSQP